LLLLLWWWLGGEALRALHRWLRWLCGVALTVVEAGALCV
jgi:hypothetical protein